MFERVEEIRAELNHDTLSREHFLNLRRGDFIKEPEFFCTDKYLREMAQIWQSEARKKVTLLNKLLRLMSMGSCSDPIAYFDAVSSKILEKQGSCVELNVEEMTEKMQALGAWMDELKEFTTKSTKDTKKRFRK